MYISRHTFLDNAVTRFLFLYIILYLIAPVLNFVLFLISLWEQQQLFETSSKRASNDLVIQIYKPNIQGVFLTVPSKLLKC